MLIATVRTTKDCDGVTVTCPLDYHWLKRRLTGQSPIADLPVAKRNDWPIHRIVVFRWPDYVLSGTFPLRPVTKAGKNALPCSLAWPCGRGTPKRIMGTLTTRGSDQLNVIATYRQEGI